MLSVSLREWPLTTNTADSEALLAAADAAGVRHVVGLQRRMSPSARYAADLIRDGVVGSIHGVTMSVGVDAFGAALPERAKWVLDPENFVHLLPVYFGHFGDLLFTTVGRPETLTASGRRCEQEHQNRRLCDKPRPCEGGVRGRRRPVHRDVHDPRGHSSEHIGGPHSYAGYEHNLADLE